MSMRSTETDEFLAHVGLRVRTLRQERQWTVQHLADAGSLSRRMLTQIELGQANPSLATIDRIAHALGTTFSSLAVTTTSPAEVTASHSRAWDGPHGSSAHILGASSGHGDDGAHSAELWRWHLAPGVRYEAEPDREGTEEIHHVLAGTLFIELEDVTIELGEGMSTTFGSDQHYSFRAGSNSAVEFVRVVVGA
jgi:transcriptional regulator with XRE-family HTH domain